VHDHTLHVKADLPGIGPKDVEVTVEGNLLTLKGERKAEQERKGDNYLTAVDSRVSILRQSRRL